MLKHDKLNIISDINLKCYFKVLKEKKHKISRDNHNLYFCMIALFFFRQAIQIFIKKQRLA